MDTHLLHPLCNGAFTRSQKRVNVPQALVQGLRNGTTLYTVLRSGTRTGVMVLDYHPFVWPPWNAAVSSQRRTCKLSLTLSESTRRDGLRLPVRRSDLYRQTSLCTFNVG